MQMTFDPFKTLPFAGYLDPFKESPEVYQSLAHFYYAERLFGIDKGYRNYLLKLSDPDLFRLEVEGVGITSGIRPEWNEIECEVMRAGIYMQAIAQKNEYAIIFGNAGDLNVDTSSISDVVTLALGFFINDVNALQTRPKGMFFGECNDSEYVIACLTKIFANKPALCVYGLEGQRLNSSLSAYSRMSSTAFSLVAAAPEIGESLSEIKKRCTHIFHFQGGDESASSTSLLRAAQDEGINVITIPPKE